MFNWIKMNFVKELRYSIVELPHSKYAIKDNLKNQYLDLVPVECNQWRKKKAEVYKDCLTTELDYIVCIYDKYILGKKTEKEIAEDYERVLSKAEIEVLKIK